MKNKKTKNGGNWVKVAKILFLVEGWGSAGLTLIKAEFVFQKAGRMAKRKVNQPASTTEL